MNDKQVYDLQGKNQEETKKQENIIQKTQTVLVFIPLTIPACGKSFLVQNLIKQFSDVDEVVDFYTISSDDIRNQLMKEYLQNHPQATDAEAFDKTARPYRGVYDNQLNDLLHRASKSDKHKVLVFLDKNHPLNAIDNVIKTIRQCLPKALIVGILPETKHHLWSYPFSLNYLCASMFNVLKRGQHQTLNGTEQHRVCVVIQFFKFFRGVKKEDVEKVCDKVLVFPFNTEVEDYYKSPIYPLLKTILHIKEFDQIRDSKEMPELIEEIKKLKIIYPQYQDQIKIIHEFVDQLQL